jgi:hypothetical protein
MVGPIEGTREVSSVRAKEKKVSNAKGVYQISIKFLHRELACTLIRSPSSFLIIQHQPRHRYSSQEGKSAAHRSRGAGLLAPRVLELQTYKAATAAPPYTAILAEMHGDRHQHLRIRQMRKGKI